MKDNNVWILIQQLIVEIKKLMLHFLYISTRSRVNVNFRTTHKNRKDNTAQINSESSSAL